jgi:oxygen-independent coproporphyrinogen III oxidase
MDALIRKYDVPAPRYTSYPSVPDWDESAPSAGQWEWNVLKTLELDPNFSLYIHLPFCEQLCTYCACNKYITTNHRVESPYVDAVLKEWDHYTGRFQQTPTLHELHLGGGTPTFFSPESLHDLLSKIKDKVVIAPNAALSFEAHPASTSLEHLVTLHDLGFTRLSLGVQDVSQDILSLINRHQTVEQVRQVCRQARDFGYTSINFDLVYGLPRQKIEHILATIDLVRELRPNRIAFYSYAHVPWLKNGQRAFDESDLPNAADKRSLYETGKLLLLSMGYSEIGMDHFALPGDDLKKARDESSLYRNFMGYTSAKSVNLIGLGCSSISQVGDYYLQNAKGVFDYQNAWQKGQHPICRGHHLSEEDKILRIHIQNLMCKGFTSWRNPDNYTPFIEKSVEMLKPLQADGLIEMEPFGLRITPFGDAFLRNICLAFDARHLEKDRRMPTFSKAI